VAALESDAKRLDITEHADAGEIVLTLDGELDLASTSELVDATRRALRHRPSRLILDLHNVEFVDLAGFRALIRCRRIAAAKDTPLLLDEPSPAVVRMFDISGLRAVFDVRHSPVLEHPTTDEDAAEA